MVTLLLVMDLDGIFLHGVMLFTWIMAITPTEMVCMAILTFTVTTTILTITTIYTETMAEITALGQETQLPHL